MFVNDSMLSPFIHEMLKINKLIMGKQKCGLLQVSAIC